MRPEESPDLPCVYPPRVKFLADFAPKKIVCGNFKAEQLVRSEKEFPRNSIEKSCFIRTVLSIGMFKWLLINLMEYLGKPDV